MAVSGREGGPVIPNGPLVLGLSALPPSMQCLWSSKDAA